MVELVLIAVARGKLMFRKLCQQLILTGATAALISGCSILPTSGPSAYAISTQESQDNDPGGYLLVDIDERVASICAAQPRGSLKVFADFRPSPDLRIGIGDSVSVTIWEASSGGLFSAAVGERGSTSGSRTATLPDQVVPKDGTIQVPYAGRLKVAGQTPADVEKLVVDRLQGKAIEPQAVVTISRNTSNTVSVTGEVVGGMRVPLTVKGDRLLDVIASAGGIRVPAHESFVKLTRRNSTISVAFNTILANPQENIFMRPDDIITVVREPQKFTAFGSTGMNASVTFDAAGITLEEALAKAGGLIDTQSDPAGVFLFRFEPTKLVEELVPNRPMPSEGNLIPVVYRLNLRDANSFFLARAFQVKDKDIIYVTNAPSVSVQKFLGLVSTVSSPVLTGVAVSRAVR
jgi:polysaccharide export outer membrane protein